MHPVSLRRLALLLCIAPVLAACLLPLSAAAQDFDSLFSAYLAGYWKANPGLATRAGVHAYDTLLPDFSAAAVQAEIARHREFLSQFERLSQGQPPGTVATATSARSRADLEVVLNHIRLALFDLDEMQAWKTRPDLLVSVLSDAVRDLVVQEFAPAGRRFEAADARLKQLPRALRALRANFIAPQTPRRRPPATQPATPQSAAPAPSEHSTRAAIALSQAAAIFIDRAVPQEAAEQGADRKLAQRVNRDAAAAAAAFRDFARWLESALLPLSRGAPFLPPDAYARRFRYYLATGEQPAELRKAAEADLAGTRDQMRRLAESIAPGRPLAETLESLAQDHPASQALLSAYQAAAARARRFVEDHKLVPLPVPERLRIDRAPGGFPADRATLDVPGPFEPDLIFHLYAPNLDRLGLEAGDRALLENNSWWIQLVALHELYPGHYQQLDLMNRSGNLPQKVFANPAFVSGWAQYCEQMMFEEGFGAGPGEPDPPAQPAPSGTRNGPLPRSGQAAGVAPGLRLFQLLRALRAQAAAIADVGLHSGTMNAAEAVTFLVEQGLLSKDRAEEQVRDIVLAPAALAADYAGKRGILLLREELRKKEGPAFVLPEFHEQLISLGAPPLPAARQVMLEALDRLGKQ